VVELAGLQEQCDFVEQATVTGEGGTLRPDMVVRLPGGSQVVIDAKAPLLAWLAANEAGGPVLLDDEQRRALYRDHARQVRAHVGNLADKLYWAQFERAPDFVVLFLPTEAVLGAALEADPELHEEAISRHVLLATPMTLIALLRTVAYGWRQDALAANAKAISEQGRALYERLSTFAARLAGVGRHLRRSVDAYNETVGSLETRVLPAARRLKESQAVAEEAELPDVPPVDAVPRTIQAEELLAPLGLRGPGDETAN
jgi:DNA recombination protein RmuC